MADWIASLGLFLGFGIAGAVLGLRFKMGALTAGSLAVLVATLGVAFVSSWSFIHTLAAIGLGLICLQAGYLAGSALARR